MSIHISSLIIHVRPDSMDAVRQSVSAAGGEIPAEDPAGKLIAVLETADEAAVTRFADEIALKDGVYAANLVWGCPR